MKLARTVLWFPTSLACAVAGCEKGIYRMSITQQLFGVHADALALRQKRMEVLASNIANAATPNYKARDVDFRAALDLISGGQETDRAVASAMRFRTPLQPSLDGNTVEAGTEQMAFAENAMAYRSSLSFLQGKISTISKALRGE
jgi:flagellar basal-body rod protein FlgB